jgi:hypothetical protein
MHPVISQAIASERAREFRARAAATGHARQTRLSHPARRIRRLSGFAHAQRAAAEGSALRPRAA